MKLLIFVVMLAAFVATSLALKNEICGLPHSLNSGRCLAHLFNWSYDPAKNKCVEFVYGGCGGNANNFSSLKKCIDTCVD